VSHDRTNRWRTVPQEVVLDYVVREVDRYGGVSKVILFGSRARGDARPFSDYDLVVRLEPTTSKIGWLAFAERLDDEAPTLCRLSLVELRPSLRPELLSNIEREGTVLYER